MAHSSQLSPRKQPSQQRSRETVAAIVDAAARVIAERGYAGSTTNHIAEVAGVSIGSLYEYFPNKDAVLVALAERHVGRMLADVEASLASARDADDSLPELMRRFVCAMLSVHERDPVLHGVLASEAPHPPELHACVLQMEEKLAHAVEALIVRSGHVARPDSDTAAHLVVQTVEALTHRYAHQGIHDLASDVFVDEVVALLCGYLTGRDGTLGGASTGRR